MPLALIRKSWDRVEPCRRVRHVSTMSAFLADFAYFQSRRTQVAIDRMRESANVVEDAVFEDQHKEGRGVGLDDDSLIKDSLKGTSNNDDFVVCSTAVAARRSFSLLIWRGCV